jgi:hypothetical protein
MSLTAHASGQFTCAMFLTDQRVLPVGIDVARMRLVDLVHGGWLSGASKAAYHDAIDHLLPVGLSSDVPCVSWLVRVEVLEPVHRRDSMTMGMRWEAFCVTGGLFPALDADIRLTTEGEAGTRMTLNGVYRPPLAALRAGLDRVLLHRVATATIHSLMTNLARALESAAPGADAPGAPVWWETRLKRAS